MCAKNGEASPNKKEASPNKKAAAGPIDFIFRYNPDDPKPFFIPKNWQDAANELKRGNSKIVRYRHACLEGKLQTRPPVVELSKLEVELEPKGDDGFPAQLPFAAIVGCADARVPAEFLFGQEFNDLFNIRVAGNVLAPECAGSLLYALKTFVPEGPGKNLRGLKLVIALGHRGCGAVKAAVQAYRSDVTGSQFSDDPISAILKRILSPSVIVGARALDTVFGAGSSLDERFHLLLVELVVYLNAAWLSHELRKWVVLEGDEAASKVGVVYGVYDPGDFHVRSRPQDYGNPSNDNMFAPPPRDMDELSRIAVDIARSLHHSFGGGPPTFAANRAFFP